MRSSSTVTVCPRGPSKAESLLGAEDSALLYLVLLTLYEEGVRPTYSELHFKLREHKCSPMVERRFLSFYLMDPTYAVYLDGALLDESHTNLERLAFYHRQRYQTKSPPSKTAADSTGDESRSEAINEVLILLRKEPSWFRGWVNIRNPENPYPPHLWIALISYFRECTSNSIFGQHLDVSRATRYAVARSVKEHGPELVRQYRLGEVAHMVQLAIHEGLLCYESNTIQPVWSSLLTASMRAYTLLDHEVAVSSQDRSTMGATWSNRPQDHLLPSSPADEAASTAASSANLDTPNVSLTDLREALRALLLERPTQKILLSQLRSLLQTRLKRNISPRAFGYTKLSNLLMERCSDVCQLVRHGGRHVFVELPSAVHTLVPTTTTTTTTVVSRAVTTAASEERKKTVVSVASELMAELERCPSCFGVTGGCYMDSAITTSGAPSPDWDITDLKRLRNDHEFTPISWLLNQSLIKLKRKKKAYADDRSSCLPHVLKLLPILND